MTKTIDTLKQINFVRIKKEVYLPCELVDFNGNKKRLLSTYSQKNSNYIEYR